MLGMSGGVVVLAVAPGTTYAGAGAFAVATLRTLPADAIALEVRNAQISLEAVYNRAAEKVRETRDGLEIVEEELVRRVQREKDHNDPGAPRIKAATKALEITRNALDWVQDRARWSGRARYGKAKHDAKDWVGGTVDNTRRAAKDVVKRVPAKQE